MFSSSLSALRLTCSLLCGALFAFATQTSYAADFRGIDLTLFCSGISTVVDVYSPPGAANLPVVMIVHGGGWVAGSRTEFSNVARDMGNWGFVTVNIDYPLNPYLPASTMIPIQVASIQCVRRWIDHVIHVVGGNAGKVGVMGHSAGGHLSTIVSILEPSRYKAVVSWGGKYDISSFAWNGALNYLSPIHQISDSTPPIRVIHAVGDRVIPHWESVAFRNRAHQVRNPGVELVTFPGDHGYAQYYTYYMQWSIHWFYAFMKYR